MKRVDLGPNLLLSLLLVLTSLLPSRVFADGATPDVELQVERQLGCPICTNLPLNVCDNQICQQMKGIIRQKLDSGESPNQIVAFFVSRYGDGVLLTPPQEGFSLAVWYFPAVAVALGGLAIWVFVRASLRRQRHIDRRLGESESDLEAYRRKVRREVESIGDQP